MAESTGRRVHVKLGATSEWYTPAPYVWRARQVMGGIDLDPASSAEANATVGALEWYGRGQDGLTLPWFGRVWLNPPYSDYAGQAAAWAGRLLREYVIGNVEQACMLVNMSVAYQPAFQAIAGVATAALCIVNHRIAFVPGGGGQGARPSQSNVIYYVGPHVAGFAAVFGEIGAVLAPVAVAERAAAVAPVQPGLFGVAA